MNVSIISPTKTIFEGSAISVNFPSMSGKFTALENHAPIVSVLEKGEIIIETQQNSEKQTIEILSGFVEIHDNIINACVETE